jgi:hypothetical protein
MLATESLTYSVKMFQGEYVQKCLAISLSTAEILNELFHASLMYLPNVMKPEG